MSDDNEDKDRGLASSIFIYPPDDEEYKEWALELAGDDPARQAAIESWFSIDMGFGVAIDYNSNRFSSIRVQDFDPMPEHLRDMHLFPEIEVISFVRAKLSDKVLEILSQQKHVTEIVSEDGRYLDNRVCRAISGLENLEVLRLLNTRIDDEGAQHLSKLNRLVGLHLENAKVSSVALQSLARLKNLTHLGLAGTRVDDEGLRHLVDLSNLVWLELDNTLVSDAGIEHLLPLKSLRVLTLANTAVTDRAVEVFAGFDSPNRINLEGTKITNKAARLLAPLPKLGDVNLRNTAVDDGCVTDIEKMKVLHALDLRDTKISKEGIERIAAAIKPSAIFHNDYGIRPDRGR